MAVLLKILKKTALPFGLILAVILAIAMARSRLAMLQRIPLWLLLVVVGVVLLIWVATLIVNWLGERKRARALEEGILGQAQASADRAAPASREAILALQRDMSEAMAVLRNGPQGKKALYALPWYLIIGPSGIGKTILVKNSGLGFPGLTTAKLMRGAGGTRHCDWWLSSEAILLDTAGRYADARDRSDTEPEWFAFLDLLRKSRKRRPIDGVILAYSIEDLHDKDELALIASARELRQRMEEILDRLGWTFPVYIVFTKCDLIAGFIDYFSVLSPLERQQVWGAVYGPEPQGDQRAAARFAEEFDPLLANLRAMRPRRMSDVARSEDWGRVLMFPEEFASLRERMVLFIETLFEANPFRKDVPIFRGTYFSSGMQEGVPFDLVVRKIQAMLGARVPADEPPQQEQKHDAYFVRDLFTKVLKADRTLAGLTDASARRRQRVELGIATGFLALGILACVTIGISYGRLRGRLDGAADAAKDLHRADSAKSATEELVALEELRGRLGGSWSSFPLTVGGEVRAAIDAALHRAVAERVLVPAERRIAADLRAASGLDADRARSALRAELLLLRPQEGEQFDISAQTLAEDLHAYVLGDGVADPDVEARLVGLADAFLHAGRPVTAGGDRRAELGAGARRLAQSHNAAAFCEGVVAAAGRRHKALTLTDLVPDQGLLSSRREIGFAFTATGWEDVIRPSFDRVPETIAADNRLIVLAGGNPAAAAPSRQDVFEIYLERYEREWTDFFDSVRLAKSYDDCVQYADDLRQVCHPKRSPLLALLRQAAGAAGLAGAGVGELAEVRGALKPLSDLALSAGDGDAPSEVFGEYQKSLEEVYQSVATCAEGEEASPSAKAALRNTKNVANDFAQEYPASGLARALRNLLLLPPSTAETLLSQQVRHHEGEALQDAWLGPYDHFRNKLADRYPFGGQDEAEIGAVLDFFAAEGQIAGFAAYVEESKSSISPAQRRAIENAKNLRQDLRLTAGGFSTRFKMKALGVASLGTPEGAENMKRIDIITLTINGVALEDRLVKAERSFEWASDDRDLDCSLALTRGRQTVVAGVRKSGSVWSICRLFDDATIERDGGGRRVTWTFPEQGVKVEYLLTWDGDREPFFVKGSALRQYKLGGGGGS